MNEPQKFQFKISTKKGLRKFYVYYFWNTKNYIGKPRVTNVRDDTE